MRTEANNKAVQQAGVQLLAQLTSGPMMTATSKEEVAAVLAAMRTNAADMSLQVRRALAKQREASSWHYDLRVCYCLHLKISSLPYTDSRLQIHR